MTFFSKKKLQPRQIEIDENTITAESPEVQQRLDRIDENFAKLNTILDQVESKIRNDDRLNEIDQSITEIEIQVDGRKRKWRSRKPKTKAKKRKSANPKKPR